MGTALNPNPGTQITGDDEQDLQTLIRAELEKLSKALPKTADEIKVDEAKKPEPLKISIFGQEQSFDDPVALGKAIEAALTNVRDATAAQFADQKSKNDTKPEPQSTFNQEKFAELIGSDVLKGFDYALGHLIFNGETDNASQKLRSSLSELEKTRQTLAAYQFKEMVPNFPASPQTVQALEQIRQSLGLPADRPESWEAAYSLGVMRGLIPAPKQPEQVKPTQTDELAQLRQQFQFTPAGTYMQPVPPTFGRSSRTEALPDWVSKAENLPEDQLEQFLKRFHG